MAWTKEQEEAIYKSGTNIIVSAGAGSGKTAVLSERVLQKVKSGVHVNELLILTFTNAAAAEMKDRIRKNIEKDPNLSDELNLINSAYITTFDSFALSVLKKYHYLLNVPKNIGITDESIVKIQTAKILDELFEEFYLSNDSFKELINKYCVKNDKNIKNTILRLYDNISSYIDKEFYYDYCTNEFFSDNNIKSLYDKYLSILNEKREFVLMELENCSFYFDADNYEKLNESVSNIICSDVSELYLITKYNSPRIMKLSDDEKAVKENLKKACNELIEMAAFGSYDDIRNKILSSKYFINEIINIVKALDVKLKEYKLLNNIYTFNDVAMSAIEILKNNSSVRDELRNSFKEIMIDEYQDTNDVQEIFISMISNNNVYMVGDIKQSIYRFRGSNPDIFKSKYDNYSNCNGGIKIDLIKNFRSREEVLKNINDLFELIMDNEIGGAEYRVSHEMVYGNTNYDSEKIDSFNYDMKILEYVNDKNSGYTNSEVEIFAIANDIKKKMNDKMKVFDKKTSKLRDIKYSDFVVILDRSKYFNDFKKIFEYMHIPLNILKDDDLKNSTDIYLIKNMFDLVYRINSSDFGIEFKYDFVSIARSFLYEYSDLDIFEILCNNSFKNTTIFKDFSEIESINSKSIVQIFSDILDVCDMYNKINRIGDYENINQRLSTLYNLCISFNDLGYSIVDFVDYLDEIIKNDKISIKYSGFSGNGDSVKILTIHKSKGLEYPVCYFADLDHNFNASDLKELFVADKRYGVIVPLIDEDKNLIKELYKYDFYKEEISEKIRLFYVALTRAREHMIIVIPSKETIKFEKDSNGVIDYKRRIKFKKLSDMIYSVKDYLPHYFDSVTLDDLDLTKKYLTKRDVKDLSIDSDIDSLEVREINIVNELIEDAHFSKESNTIIDKSSYNNMKYGTMIHEVLEFFDFKNPDYNLISDDFIKNKINVMLNSDIFSNIVNANIYKEYEFIYEKDGIKYHGIIDLLLEYDDHIDIIDYKLKNTIDHNYKKQLLGYKEYLNSISDKNVYIYLYSIIDSKVESLN